MAVKPKMRECKLRSVIHFQGALKQKGIKEAVVKQDPRCVAYCGCDRVAAAAAAASFTVTMDVMREVLTSVLVPSAPYPIFRR